MILAFKYNKNKCSNDASRAERFFLTSKLGQQDKFKI
jgi:hypothetical protein